MWLSLLLYAHCYSSFHMILLLLVSPLRISLSYIRTMWISSYTVSLYLLSICTPLYTICLRSCGCFLPLTLTYIYMGMTISCFRSYICPHVYMFAVSCFRSYIYPYVYVFAFSSFRSYICTYKCGCSLTFDHIYVSIYMYE